MSTKWPSKKEIERMIKKIHKEDLWFIGPPEHPTPLQQFRFDLQQKFALYIHRTKITQKEMAEIRKRLKEIKTSLADLNGTAVAYISSMIAEQRPFHPRQSKL